MIIGAPVGFFGAAAAGAALTWNPSVMDTNITLSNSDRTATSSVGGYTWRNLLGVDGKSSGKRYFEVYCTYVINDAAIIGVANSSLGIGAGNNYLGRDANSWGYRPNGGEKVHSGSFDAYGSAFSTGDVIGIALDFAAGKLWFAKNNTWQASGDPAAGSNPAYTGMSGTLYPAASLEILGSVTLTLPGSFAYSPPSGFSSW